MGEKKHTILLVIEKSRLLFSLAKKNILFLAIVGIVGAGLGFLIASMSEKVYTAKSTFMLDSGSGGSAASGYMKLARKFGVGGGGGGGSELSADMLTELVKSRRVVYGALLGKTLIGGKQDLLVNHYVEHLLKNPKSEKEPVKIVSTSWEEMSVKEDSVMSRVYGHLLKSGFSSLMSKKTGIITIKLDCKNPDIAIETINQIFKYVKTYYGNKATEKERNSYDVVVHRVDSILNELEETEQLLADYKDRSKGLRKAAGKLDELKLRRKAKILNVMYAQGIKNREIAKFTLDEKRPVIQVIDLAKKPLIWKKASKKNGVIFGGILAGLLGLLFIFIKHELKRILENA